MDALEQAAAELRSDPRIGQRLPGPSGELHELIETLDGLRLLEDTGWISAERARELSRPLAVKAQRLGSA